MTIAYIGLGSNLGNPVQQLDRAISAIQALPGTRLLGQSSFYQSTPLEDGTHPVVDGPQPDYVNAAVMLDTSLTPFRLLEYLLDIETKQGRIRGARRWQARTLDLDLLLYGEERIRTEDLVVPHPEITNRNFVLLPLAEITPDLNIPGKGRVNDLLADIGTADIVKIKK